MKKILSFLLFLQLLIFVGCSSNVSLKGRVTFSDDDSPVSAGTVCFVKDSFQASGKLDANGNYVVGSLKATDGLPVGSYNVYIADAKKQTGTKKVKQLEIDGTTKEVDEPVYGMLVDSKFCDPKTSGLTIEVKGSTSFDFKVDRFKP
ncbi:MAG: hypothetical protein LBP59_17035 [Planctomycetaceae bacterium]|nr:hypothetical protein [Planctomycetaceae bacterium]